MFNVTKSAAPTGGFKYNDNAIERQVKDDFFDKCYLCEEKVPRHLEVEHFYPQAHYPHLVHHWDNLLCICQKCNKIRPKQINTTNEDEVLNCCEEDVEVLIQLRFLAKEKKVEITGSSQQKIKNTIELLDRIHNGGNKTKSNSYSDLQKLIVKELAKLEEDITNLMNYQLEKPFKDKIKQRLSRQSAFMAIKRTYINDFNPEFTELFD
jgi:hypothetical protein